MNVHLPKGSIYKCSGCGLDILKTKRDLFSGQTIDYGDIEGIGNQTNPQAGLTAACVSCKEIFKPLQLAKHWRVTVLC